MEHRTAGGREKPGSVWMRTGKVSTGLGTERGPCALRLAHCLPPGSAPKVVRVEGLQEAAKGPAHGLHGQGDWIPSPTYLQAETLWANVYFLRPFPGMR